MKRNETFLHEIPLNKILDFSTAVQPSKQSALDAVQICIHNFWKATTNPKPYNSSYAAQHTGKVKEVS